MYEGNNEIAKIYLVIFKALCMSPSRMETNPFRRDFSWEEKEYHSKSNILSFSLLRILSQLLVCHVKKFCMM